MKNIKLILYPITVIVSIVLAYFLISSVKKPIDEIATIKKTEAAIIKKLEIIRDLQVAYQIQNGRYAGKWSELVDFAKNGSLYIINISETTKLNERGKEEVSVQIDTLGTVPVADSILSKYESNPNIPYEAKEEYKSIMKDLDNLPIIPGSGGKKFAIYAGKIYASENTKVDVFEVKDIYPINPERGGAFNIEDRVIIDSLIKDIEPKIEQLETNVEFYESKMQPYINKKAPFEKKYEQLKKESKLDSTIDNSAEMEKLRTEKILPIEKEMAPHRDKWQKEMQKLEKLEELLKIYIEKPLRVGSRTKVVTSGNWE